MGRVWLIFRGEAAVWGDRGGGWAATGGKKWQMAGKRLRVWAGSGWGLEGWLAGGGEGMREMAERGPWRCSHTDLHFLCCS